jgi:glutathione S-transferase
VQRTLHHFPLDPASRQARLALGEKKLPFEAVTVRYWEAPAEFAKLSPSGLTPVLVETEGGRRTVISEIRAIVEHLEETAPQPPLMGRDAAERAETRRLLQWFDRKFDAEVDGYILREKLEKRLTKMGAPDLANMRLGREAPAQLRRFRRGGAPVGAGLLRRRAVARAARRQDLVHEGEVAPGVSAAAGRSLARPRAGGPL